MMLVSLRSRKVQMIYSVWLQSTELLRSGVAG